MNEITVFDNEEFGRVREITIDNEPWFIGKDIAEALGYGDGNGNSKALANAIKDHVDDEDKKLMRYEDFKGYQNGDLKNISHYGAYIINESGVYALIFGSKLESAKRFKHWVTHEVLPSIRKTGGYSMNKYEQGINGNLLEIVNLQRKEIAELTNKLSSLTAPRESVQVSQVAYMLQNKGVDIGRNNFIKFLRDNGYMIKNENRINLATKRSLDEGLMELKEKEVTVRGNNFMNIQTFITPKGQDYFLKMFTK